MRVLDYLLRHRSEAQTLKQAFSSMTDYDQISLILALGMTDNLLGRVPDSHFEVQTNSLGRGLCLQRRQDLLVVFLRILYDRFGLHVIAEFRRTRDGKHIKFGIVFLRDIESERVGFVGPS